MNPRGGESETFRFVETIRRLAPGAHVIRVRPDGSVTVYRADFAEIGGRDPAHDARIAELLRDHYRSVNWRVAHDFWVQQGALRAAPQPGQKGSRPVVDRTFGSGFGPLYTQGVEIS